ncbi:Hsp20/alpha crystallin family protein [Thermaerobacter sp. PB12/4term]|nr:Hsp20/alpha crystallin family protein [Thermaerobacter sp. PB12/4term]
MGMRTDLDRWSWPAPAGRGLSSWREMFWRPWDFWRAFDGEADWAFGQRPSVDVTDAGDKVVVEAEMPGVEPEDIQLDVYEDRVVIRSETRRETRNEGDGYYLMERRFGRFHRVVPLPERVNPEGAQARCRNGVLRVEIPKLQDQGRGRRVPVTGA